MDKYERFWKEFEYKIWRERNYCGHIVYNNMEFETHIGMIFINKNY